MTVEGGKEEGGGRGNEKHCYDHHIYDSMRYENGLTTPLQRFMMY